MTGFSLDITGDPRVVLVDLGDAWVDPMGVIGLPMCHRKGLFANSFSSSRIHSLFVLVGGLDSGGLDSDVGFDPAGFVDPEGVARVPLGFEDM